MPKTLIIVIVFISLGCTSRLLLSEGESNWDVKSAENSIAEISKNNISDDNYFIQKADLILKRDNSTSKFIFTGKFEKPDKFLFSIKSITGIEGARIYITKDTILINDRIQKRLLCGNGESLVKLFGVTYSFINIIFGDLILIEKNEKWKMERINNQLILVQGYMKNTLKSNIENKVRKVNRFVFVDELNREEISLEYSKFSKAEKHFPEVIVFNDYKRNISARIRLKKITTPWSGAIEFVPGREYKVEEIR